MERLTYFDGGKWRLKIGDTEYSGEAVDRLAAYENTGLEPEDILGDEYDLERLRELAQADKDGRCVVLPVKPGGMVQLKGNPSLPPEKVDCINLYADGKMTFSFHEVGVKTRYVDEWSEDSVEKYIAISENALRREQG